MQIRNKIIKPVLLLAIFEGIYLFLVPAMLNTAEKQGAVRAFVSDKINASVEYDYLKFKTHFIPAISVQAGNFSLSEKNSDKIIELKNPEFTVRLLPLVLRKVDIKSFYASDIEINLVRDENGIYNIQKLFSVKKNNKFKVTIKNTNIYINNLKSALKDDCLTKSLVMKGFPFVLKTNSRKKEIFIQYKGELTSNNQLVNDFDIKFTSRFPFKKEFDKNLFSGNIVLYSVDLDLIKPFISCFFDKNLKQLSGFVDYLQISSFVTEDNSNSIVLNSLFKNLEFDKSNWKNHIIADGINKIDANIDLKEENIKINSFNYNADNIDINSFGDIKISDKPELDVTVKVKNSRAENIVNILPPNLVPKLMTIEKVKTYGVFGDIEADVNIKGKIPQPDITGYVKGRNVHILDKTLHKLHKGSVDINFDKRILNMDIIVDIINNQQAKINGNVYMFRDGVNHVCVKTTDNLDFPLAQKIIIPISKVFNFQLGPIPDMNITSGKGIIDLDIKGSLDLIDINGFSSFDKAELTYNGLFGEIHDGKGRLDFNKDVITFKSERAFVKNNPLEVAGSVKINSDLDFNIKSAKAQAVDVLEIINKSSLLKDVKAGMTVITDASGLIKLDVNIKSDIVPVPFGQPPLPPEEAFINMKVNGSVFLFSDSAYLQGFYTPIEKIRGIVDFTETNVILNDLEAVSGESPIKISGKIVNDLQTKIPDVDVTVTSKSVNLKDTIKFLTKSYLYPKNYPDLSLLYNVASKHDLYFKYKAKSIDFITDCAYAVMNFIPDNSSSSLKAKSGKVILEKSNVKVENVKAALYNSNISVNGIIKRVDTVNPIYTLKIKSDLFNISNLNDISTLTIIPNNIKTLFKQFNKYGGYANIDVAVDKNVMNGQVKFSGLRMNHIQNNAPFVFDDFTVHFNNKKIYVNDLTAQIADMPLYGDVSITDVFNHPKLNGYFTSKLNDNFIKSYFPSSIADKLSVNGDVNLSSGFLGVDKHITLSPKLTLNPDSDITFDGVNFGEITEKREFVSDIDINEDMINVKKFNYIKYISSQNNKTYPIVFANANAILKIQNDNIIIPQEIYVKTNKNLPARLLNLFLKNQILRQGSFNCDLKYITDAKTQAGKILGKIDCHNIDIPLFDTLLKNIKVSAKNDKIDLSLFGFMSDGKIQVNSILENKISTKPIIKSLNIYAQQFDDNKFFESLTQVHKAMNTNNEIKNLDLSGLSIENGYLDVKTLTFKNLVANNFTSTFSIDKNGVFKSDKINVEVGSGKVNGNLSYNLSNSEFDCDFELNNVDANYAAENLFDAKDQIYGSANGKIILKSQGSTNQEIIKNLAGFVYFEILDGRMPKLGSLEYLLRASNIIKSGITGFTINSILELLNLVKTGYFSNINGSCKITDGIADNIEIYSTGENLSLYIHGNYDISNNSANMEILGKLSKKISTIFGAVGNTSLNTFFKLIPGISLLDFGRKDFIEDVEKIPQFTNGDYESRTFQAIIKGNINSSNYVQSFKWVK